MRRTADEVEVDMLKVGDAAPDFTLQTDAGSAITLSSLRDKPVVLFFYPKDDTPGCTIECKEFRDARPQLEHTAHLLGISPDDRQSHEAFRDKFGLNFPLLSDLGHAVAERYGAWGTTKWGTGILRTTFIIRDGKIAQVFEQVKPQGHAQQVLEALG
jgi:peroxiredoxin Q/BCP